MNQATKLLSLTCALAALFTSCTKERGSVPDPSTVATQLQVALNESYLPASKVDSALAIWEVNGTVQTVKLTRNGQNLVAPLAAFNNNGQGMLSVQLFTQTRLDQMPLQWEQRFAYTLSRTTPVKLAAPGSIQDHAWNPRAICKSEISGARFTAILALRPEDAYFELKDVPPAVARRIEVVRSFYLNDTTNLVTSRGWTGDVSTLNPQGNLVDRTHFQTLPGQIDGRPWNKYKIRASFYARITPGEIYEIEFEQNKL